MNQVHVTVAVTEDCEGLLTSLPRGYEYELIEEDYEASPNTVTFAIHGIDELTSGMIQALNTNDDVISYDVS